MQFSREDAQLGRNVLKGAAAGAVATWAMGKVTTWLYARESDRTRAWEEQARGGQSAYETAAQTAAGAVGVELSDEQRQRSGSAIHWMLGAAAGAAYAIARHERPAVGSLNGIAFGVVFFLIADELMNPLLGLTPGPMAFPWQAHARGLAGHVTYGVVTDTTIGLLDRVA